MKLHLRPIKFLFILLFLAANFTACKKDENLPENVDAIEDALTNDNDGLADDVDPDPNNSDTDGDGIPDGMDVDPDGDGTNDNGTDTDGDGINDNSDVDTTGGTDSDGDGIDDDALDPTDSDEDNLPDDLDPDSNNPDTDDDDINDGADVDADGDGVNDNGTDNDNDGINDNGDVDVDGDGVNDNGTDSDNDGINDDSDNTDDSTVSTGGVISFRQAGPVGGGFPNVVTWDPNVPGKLYYGSDIGGTGISTNYGKDFISSARGLGYEESHPKIAALNAVDVNGTTVVVGGTGFKGLGGEVISSNDGGNNWNHDSSDISFSAQNSNAPLPTGRPRSTDPSLIQWVSGTTWVAGTYKDGVWISTNNRASWSRLNLFDGKVHIRAMAMSPDDQYTLYVGLWGDDTSIDNKGLWAISNLDGSPTKTKVQGIPDVVESIVVLGNRLYVACGSFGLRRYVPSNNNLSNITGPIGTEVMSTAIHGVAREWNTDRLVVGTAEGDGNIWMSDDSGASWTNTTSAGVDINPWGSNENLIVFEKHGNWVLGGNKCDIATIQVSPHDPDAWAVCATSAIWTTDDAGATWKPANGFQILSYRDVEISATGLIAAGNVDHDVLVSNDGGSSWKSVGFGDVTVSHSLTFSPDGTELAFANNERDNNNTAGRLGVASTPNTPTSPSLVEINNPTNPKRIVGLTWIKLQDGTDRLITAIDDGGVRTVDHINGNWSNWNIRSTALMGAQNNRDLRCSVVSNGASTIFIYDRKSGVWRSNDYGVNWTQVLTTTANEDTGYLAYNTTDDILYVSTPSQVLRIDNASNATNTVNLSFPITIPGAITLDPFGRLLVFSKPQSGSSECTLYRNETPETNTNLWNDIADDTVKKVSPTATDIYASAEYIVLVNAGKGLLISENDRP